MLKTPHHLEDQAPVRPFLESRCSRNKCQYVYLHAFSLRIAWRIIRIMMIFLLQSFYFVSKLFRTKETDPREAGDAAYAITASQKKNREPKHPVTWDTRGWLPYVRENFAKTRKWAKSSVLPVEFWVLPSRSQRDYLLLPG